MYWLPLLLAFGLAKGVPTTPLDSTDHEALSHVAVVQRAENPPRCFPNGLASPNSTRAAGQVILDEIRSSLAPVWLKPGACRRGSSGKAITTVCNKGSTSTSLSYDASKAAFDIIVADCAEKGSAGILHAMGNLTYTSYYMNAHKDSLGSSSLAKRQCTNGRDVPITGCSTPTCDPTIVVDENGNCPYTAAVSASEDGCSYYCEQRLALFYGPPQRYADAPFCEATDCTVDLSNSTTLEVSASFSMNLEGAGPIESVFGAGISIGVAWSTTTGYSFGASAPDGACGWWNLAPVIFQSCGVMTEFEANGGYGWPVCYTDAPFLRTTPDSCSEGQSLKLNGEADTVMVFEVADCTTRETLPMDQQSTSWQGIYGDQAAHGVVC